MQPPGLCAVTGTSGYLGGVIARAVAAAGWRIRELSRSGAASLPGSESARFALGDLTAPVDEARALVHCAWDFRACSWRQIESTNIEGSKHLLDAAAVAGVERIIFVSTLSAFPAARSSYGRAKLAVEEHVRSLGGYVVRPGLVWSERPGSLYARLRTLALRAPILPVPAGAEATLRLSHEADVAALVAQLLAGDPVVPNLPIVAAAPEPMSLASILRRAAAAEGHRLLVVPVPWRLPWLGLRLLELAGLRPRFRSDSLISLMSLAHDPFASAVPGTEVTFRPFAP